MNKSSVLKYLTSASDTFLLVAFFALVSLPIVVGLGVQPIKEEILNKENAQVVHHTAQTASVVETPAVLGVQATAIPTPDPLAKLTVSVIPSSDAKKYTIDSQSLNLSDFSANITTKVQGTYNIFKFSNANSTNLNLSISVDFLDAKSQDINIIVNNRSYPVNRSNSGQELSVVSLPANSDIIISLTSNQKNVGSFKITTKLV